MHRRTVIAALAVLSVSSPLAAQSRGQDRRDAPKDEYGELIDRAISGAQQVQDAPRTAVDPDAEATPTPSASRPAAPAPRREERVGDYLHAASEYAAEPHHVSLVDRSRYDDAFVPTTVRNTIGLQQGSILVDVAARQLYFAMPDGMLRRYGVAVGKAGKAWHGTATVGRMARWPDWHPTANIRRENRRLKERVAGGSSNPLGARAIYLFSGGRDTMYRIHGTNAPASIGRFASHGCIRMINEDVIELFSMVRPGATVVVR